MRILKFVIPGLVAISLIGCQNSQYGEKQTGGALIGGALGGLAGSQIGSGKGRLAATAAGALLGLLAGSEVGKSLDKADQQYAMQAQQSAYTAPVGQRITWNNPESGHSGTITPVRDGRDQTGAYCREYQTTVNGGGQPQQAYGTACRQPDGSWKVVN
jgi:surface antigen